MQAASGRGVSAGSSVRAGCSRMCPRTTRSPRDLPGGAAPGTKPRARPAARRRLPLNRVSDAVARGPVRGRASEKSGGQRCPATTLSAWAPSRVSASSPLPLLIYLTPRAAKIFQQMPANAVWHQTSGRPVLDREEIRRDATTSMSFNAWCSAMNSSLIFHRENPVSGGRRHSASRARVVRRAHLCGFRHDV